jgi:hypothetical protein
MASRAAGHNYANPAKPFPACPGVPWGVPEPAPGSAEEAPPACPARPGVPWSVPRDPGLSQSTFANRFNPLEAQPPAPHVPDRRVPFSMKKNPFARRR